MSVPDLPLHEPMFGLDDAARRRILGDGLGLLTAHHHASSPEYRAILDSMFPTWQDARSLEDLPFVPIGLFKRRSLTSIPASAVYKTVTSSGTGGTPSRVFLDRETASRQTRALSAIMSTVVGKERLPMLLVDTETVLTDRSSHTARAAGVAGLMGLGRKHVFLLDAEMEPRRERLEAFARDHAGERKTIFGFTYMVWRYLAEAFHDHGIDLSGSVLIHSGGWKQMESERVDNESFKARLRSSFGIESVVNFYGMAEQVGSVFIEGSDGLLHPSVLSDVIIRDPLTWEPQPIGAEGVVQVLSLVPGSYPGHSILTEDRGVIESVDDPSHGMGGKAFRILGRLPRSELRGCSDTFAAATRV